MASTGVTGYGITPKGLLVKSLEIVSLEVDSDFRAILGESAGTEPDGTIPAAGYAGQLKALFVDGIASMWDLLQAVHSSRDPNQATDASLDAVAALSGTVRSAAQASTAIVTCTGTPNTFLPGGRIVAVFGTGTRFVGAAATIAALNAWTGATPYNAGDRVTNNNRCYQCITSGISAASGGPTTTASNIADGAAAWEYLGEGTGAIDVAFSAESTGPFGALAGTLSVIVTPVSGWRTATNLADASVGRNQEKDATLRARRESEVAGSGNATKDAILANVSKVNEGSSDPLHQPPTSVEVFVNDTDFYDGLGVPPHSVEVLVRDGTDADIAQAIWNSIGAGTNTFGSSSAQATDSQGNPQTVYFTRPTLVPIYVYASVKYDQSAWPANSSTSVSQAVFSALLTDGLKQAVGRDARVSPLQAAILRGPYELSATGTAVVPASEGSPAVPGLLEVDTLYIGLSGASGTVSIGLTARQLATFDSTRTIITVATEDP